MHEREEPSETTEITPMFCRVSQSLVNTTGVTSGTVTANYQNS